MSELLEQITWRDILSILSIGLSLYAIWQAKNYNKKSSETYKMTDRLIKDMEKKLNTILIVQRKDENVYTSTEIINLHKDCVVFRKTKLFKPSKSEELISGKLRGLLQPILKETYILHVMAYIEDTIEEEECIVCLRHELDELSEKKKIEEIHTELSKYGIEVSIVF